MKPMFLFVVCVVVILCLVWFVVTQPFVGPNAQEKDLDASSENLRKHVYVLSEELPPRAHDPEALDVSADYIRGQFKQYTNAVSDQEFYVRGKIFRNVIARFGPEIGERIVIGAHYDTAAGLPGADDNASGVAGVLEIARLLEQKGTTVPVELVAYTLEESTYFLDDDMGSAVHAKSLREDNVAVKLMISLEMIGYFSDKKDSQTFPTPLIVPFYPDTGNFIGVVGNLGQTGAVRSAKKIMRAATSLPVYSMNAPPSLIPGIDFSDHRNYWRYGYPAIMVTDTAWYRNSAYHTAGDTADRLDFDRMAQVVQGVFAIIQHSSN